MVAVLRDADSTSVAEAAKKHKVSDATIYAWRKHFGQMEAADVKRLKALEIGAAGAVAQGERGRCPHPSPNHHVASVTPDTSASRWWGGVGWAEATTQISGTLRRAPIGAHFFASLSRTELADERTIS